MNYLRFYVIFVPSQMNKEREADKVAKQTPEREVVRIYLVRLGRVEVDELYPYQSI